ncbi:phosphoribosylaminoimidazolesuccinocarboxamide synthase [Thioalkalivibrio paradoxus]|uniref:Phosphoribosylaminoimidazole-succinocarboxamide synthase n=1 Tax=Thioalkalivibrio paradoxus ARh 1 TaxID=713585 RepID=W0DLP7_9GAMM|nr:phosphoribosylaminoimidazolesuccinocarboxamide synthase [Thioalkalivibrio paradoxus]AHE99524.1 phosphoribosylaminoimidazole-succinocarboxamide synthase [Thioalkalivibrio paradoxus ARh 1]
MRDALFESHIPHLPLIHRGKVRDLYAVDGDHLLMVTTDRLSAFDVVLPTPIPDKGRILTAITVFWMRKVEAMLGIPNQLTDIALTEVVADPAVRAPLEGRSLVVRRLRALPVEAVVRGYLIGSGWKDYRASGKVCGIDLPEGLDLAARLPEAIFTPSTKAELGEHDANIAFDDVVRLLGAELADQLRSTSLGIYAMAREHARRRGILIADTKFEFGLDSDGRLHLIDEVLTPDSSRFWPEERYRPGISPESFDKQFVRDYLEGLDWDKNPPGPTIPDDIVARTAERYREALRRLTAEPA